MTPSITRQKEKSSAYVTYMGITPLSLEGAEVPSGMEGL